MLLHEKFPHVTWEDIEHLVKEAVEEDTRIDFKSYRLLLGKGFDDGIRSTCKEISAFANAYGGAVVIGVEESKDAPPRAKAIEPFEDVHEIAERAERSIRDRIDPPIAGLIIKAITKPTEPNSGVILIAVPRSMGGPHGFGKPVNCYERRGADSAPMTMRDLQNVFWDSRTRRERVQQQREALSASLREMALEHPIRASQAGKPPARGIFLRISAIQHQVMRTRIDHLFGRKTPFIPQLDNSLGSYARFGSGYLGTKWFPRANGISNDTQEYDGSYCRWTLLDNGTVSACGFLASDNFEPGQNSFDPGSVAVGTGQVCLMALQVQRKSTDVSEPIEIDLEIVSDGSAQAVITPYHPPRYGPKLEKRIHVDPMTWHRDVAFSDFEYMLRQEVYRAVGVSPDLEELLDLEKYVRPT